MRTPRTRSLERHGRMLEGCKKKVTVAEAAVALALSLGYTHIDTAIGYNNQLGIAKALKASPRPRDSYFVIRSNPLPALPAGRSSWLPLNASSGWRAAFAGLALPAGLGHSPPLEPSAA